MNIFPNEISRCEQNLLSKKLHQRSDGEKSYGNTGTMIRGEGEK